MSGRREVWEDDPKSEPVLSFHDTPNYDSDPGTGVAFHIEGGEVWVLLVPEDALRRELERLILERNLALALMTDAQRIRFHMTVLKRESEASDTESKP